MTETRLDIEQLNEIKNDISRIDACLNNFDPSKALKLHREIDGKYQSIIANWGQSMWAYISEMGFNYDVFDSDICHDNLELMKAKLQGLSLQFNLANESNSGVSLTVNNTNSVNITISFETARKKIEDMPGLNEADTDEVLKKIDELEKISNENSRKKTKWEKVKPIVQFALDKGADVAITIMGLVIQMKLGM